MKQTCNVMTDVELKVFLKNKNINVLDILHTYKIGLEGVCHGCDYYVKKCWLCEQCISCCNYTEQRNEEKN